MIGIKFEIENEYNNFLDKILSHIDSDNYKWVIVESEVYTKKCLDLFNKNVYLNSDFKSLIRNHIYYTVFSNIQLYNKEDKICTINNYNEFLKSNCVLELFITDNIFVEIYTKDKKILDLLNNNAVLNDFSIIKIITDREDVRKSFSAYSD